MAQRSQRGADTSDVPRYCASSDGVNLLRVKTSRTIAEKSAVLKLEGGLVLTVSPPYTPWRWASVGKPRVVVIYPHALNPLQLSVGGHANCRGGRVQTPVLWCTKGKILPLHLLGHTTLRSGMGQVGYPKRKSLNANLKFLCYSN